VRVLLCDDHQLFSQAFSSVLRRRGDVVTTTDKPADALLVAQAQHPDVCLMDRNFSGRDEGIDAAHRMRVASPSTPVIMLTGHVDAAGVRAAIEAGVRGFLRKDEGLSRILEAIDRVTAGCLVIEASLLRPVPSPGTAMNAQLTPREQEVLERLVRGESTQVMAKGMLVSHSTARTHTQSVLLKLGVHSRLEAAAFAIRHGVVRYQPGASPTEMTAREGA
jgi:two-component system nitrate/nitrite response regulator NarL